MDTKRMLQAFIADLPQGEAAGLPAQREAIMGMLESMPDEMMEGLMQDFMANPAAALAGGGAATAMGGGAAASRAGAKKAAAPQSRAEPEEAWEGALRSCCSQAVVTEFEELPKAARSMLLKGFQSTVEDQHQNFTMQAAMEDMMKDSHMKKALTGKKELDAGTMDMCNAAMEKLHNTEQADANDSLAIAIRLNAPRLVSRKAVAHVRSVIRAWGVDLPKPMKLMKYEMGLQEHRKDLRTSDEQKEVLMLSTNKTVMKPEQGLGRHHWDSLRPIDTTGLKMFQVAKGCVLTGTLAVDPLANVGITTLLEDSRGALVQLGLYNMLPGGPTGAKAHRMAETLFPKGTRLSIAEPFLKIFMDGNRGIRVDDPPDVKVHRESEVAGPALRAMREQGGQAAKERAYASAASLYWQGLRSQQVEKEVAQLLSNRSQAKLKQKLWGGALADAAGALLLAPKSGKAWQRYASALEGMGLQGLAQRASTVASQGGEESAAVAAADVRGVLAAAFAASREGAAEQVAASKGNAQSGSTAELRDAGNQAYRSGAYGEAIAKYSAALAASEVAEEVATVLSNVALCSIHNNCLHDALAASFASLHLRPENVKARYHLAKCLARLSEHRLALGILAAGPRVAGACAELEATVARIGEIVEEGTWSPFLVQELWQKDESVLSDWIDETALSLAHLGSRGRGVVAARSIQAGEVLMIQRARVEASDEGVKAGGETLMSVDSGERKMFRASETRLNTAAASALAADLLLGVVFSSLHDGTEDDKNGKQLPSWDDLLHRLGGRVLPLLSQHPDFFPAGERAEGEQGSKRVQRVLNINIHGNCKSNESKLERLGCKPSLGRGRLFDASCSGLFPALSLMNHSQRPNCVHMPFAKEGSSIGVMVVLAFDSISKGEELTVLYLDDPAEVKSKWGIED